MNGEAGDGERDDEREAPSPADGDRRAERGDPRGSGGGSGGGGRRAWIPVVSVEDAGDELAGAYRSIGARDRAANVVAVHSLHPEALEDHHALYRTLMFGPSPLSRREREAVAVVVSAANDCFY